MKNIELTEKHKSKLLEMCKKLFSEVQIWTGIFPDGSQAPEKVLDSPMDLEWGTEWDLPYITIKNKQIHWFEFCWRLLNKILSNNKTISPIYIQKCITDFGIICFNNSVFQHPVDYLYEKYKEL
jgi:hypothetical protein